MKKRGFGVDKWNGFGGKRQGQETMAECASRELEEESGLKVAASKLDLRGFIQFQMLSDGCTRWLSASIYPD